MKIIIEFIKKYFVKIKNFILKNRLDKQNKEIKQQLDNWYNQSEEIAKEYPDFDLDGEIENVKFVDLLRKGVDMKTLGMISEIQEG